MAINQDALKRLGVKRFDIAQHLDNDAVIAAYLSEVLADGDQEELLDAIGNIARARGMSEIAKSAGLGRESLYKAFSPGAQPRFDTVLRVLRALGLELEAKPLAQP